MASEDPDEIVRLFETIDQSTDEVQRQTGLMCPPGCGSCCESDQVEATVAELIPLAKELWRTGGAEDALARAELAGREGPCIFHEPDKLCYGYGRCGIYPWRPAICRLFGFAAVRSKRGQKQLTICRLVKQVAPEAAVEAQRMVDDGMDVLCFSDVFETIAGIEPNLGREVIPINRAVALAIERVGFLLQLEAFEDGMPPRSAEAPPGNHNKPRRPRRPNRPRRAA